jgi:hypothetical protein
LSTLNFAPLPILHGIGADNVAFAIVAIIQHNKAFVVKGFLVAFVVPSYSGNTHIKNLGVAVIAIELASFEFADGVIVHGVVLFGYADKISEKRQKSRKFLQLF